MQHVARLHFPMHNLSARSLKCSHHRDIPCSASFWLNVRPSPLIFHLPGSMDNPCLIYKKASFLHHLCFPAWGIVTSFAQCIYSSLVCTSWCIGVEKECCCMPASKRFTTVKTPKRFPFQVIERKFPLWGFSVREVASTKMYRECCRFLLIFLC